MATQRPRRIRERLRQIHLARDDLSMLDATRPGRAIVRDLFDAELAAAVGKPAGVHITAGRPVATAGTSRSRR